MPSPQEGMRHVGRHMEGLYALREPMSHCSPLSGCRRPSPQIPMDASVKVHVVVQKSVLMVLPSSHSSYASRMRSPQTGSRQFVRHVPGVSAFVFPLSHCSGGSMMPLPQRRVRDEEEDEEREDDERDDREEDVPPDPEPEEPDALPDDALPLEPPEEPEDDFPEDPELPDEPDEPEDPELPEEPLEPEDPDDPELPDPLDPE